MRGPIVALAAAVFTLLAKDAAATCVQLACKPTTLERPDGSALELDGSARARLRPGEAFVVRRGCLAVCSAGGRPGGGAFDPNPAPPSYWRVGPDASACEPQQPLVARRLEGGAQLVESGLSSGHYVVEGLSVVVGDDEQPPACPTSSTRDRQSLVAIDPPPELGGQRVGAHLAEAYVDQAESIPGGRGFDFAEDWDDREDLVWEAGSGFWLGISANDGARASVSPGVVGFFGLHTMVDWPRERHEKWSMPEVEATRWCAPIACLGLGLIVAPTGVVLGNEIGAELRAVYGAETREGEGSLARISVRPVFLYARGALRTQSFVGFLLPELGAQLREGRDPALAMAWSIYPIDWRVAGPLALSLDPLRVGALVARESGASVDVGGELSLRFAP